MQQTKPLAIRDRTSFIGRSRERARLCEDLERGTSLITIAGPSGMGKTRLAATVGSDLAPIFRDEGGVWFCSLATCSTAADVEALIARTLGLSVWEPGKLEVALSRRERTLLILDNGEQIASALGGLISPWLESCPSLQILVTSIVPLEIEGETRLDLGPLELDDATTLYLQRAHQAAADWSLKDGEATIVKDLVLRLDRIPLAIELAAARVRTLPPRVLLSRISGKLELLSSTTPGKRHGSWLEALNLTWELLSPKERSLLAQATVFAGGFTLDAAVAILGSDDGASEGEVLDLLDSLRGKALLRLEDAGEVAETSGPWGRTEEDHPADPMKELSPRFSLLDSIRAFAKEKLEGAELRAEILARYATYYVELAERELARLDRSDDVVAIRALVAERDNLEEILRQCRKPLPHLATRAGLILYDVVSLSGFPLAEVFILEETVKAARDAGDGRLLARALGNRAAAYASKYRTREAEESIKEALATTREIGDEQEEMRQLLNAASIPLRAGEEAEALATLESVARWARQRGEVRAEGMALLRSAMIQVEIEDVEGAERSFRGAKKILRRHGTIHDEAQLLRCEGSIHYLRGRYREAKRVVLAGRHRYRLLGNHLQASNDSLALGMFEERAGRLSEAEAYLLEGLTSFRRMGHQPGVAFSLAILGAIAIKRGEWKLAEERFVESVAEMEETGDLLRRGRILPYLALVEAKAGRLVEAEQSIRDARAFLAGGRGPSAMKILELLEGCVMLARARAIAATAPSEAEAIVNQVRARVETFRGKDLSPTASDAFDVLVSDLEKWDEEREPRGVEGAPTLRIGPNAAWFQVGAKERVDISRRATLRGMLLALVNRRLKQPGTGIHALDLFGFGWSDEEVDPETALKRVYIGVWTLRNLGLARILSNSTEGYLLDPSVPLVRERG